MSRRDDLLAAVAKGEDAVNRLLSLGGNRTPKQNKALAIDVGSLVKHYKELVGLDDTAETLLPVLADVLLHESAILGYVRSTASHFAPLPPIEPSGIWTFTYQGRSFSGSSPMPVSIKDTDRGWGVKVSALKDAAGEKADPAATVAYSVDDDALVTLTDNGDGSASFDSAIADPEDSGIELPASTTLTATVTNPDGSTFDLEDVITVVAGSAVTGSFEFTPPS